MENPMRLPLIAVLALSACVADVASTELPQPDRTAPKTTLSPRGGTYTGAQSILVTTDEPANLRWTLDGSDPRTSTTAKTGRAPVAVTLEAPSNIAIRVSATDDVGNVETPHSEGYLVLERLEGPSISGRLFGWDDVTTGSSMVLLYDRDPTQGGADPKHFAEVSRLSLDGSPWAFEKLAAGTYWVAAAWWNGEARGDPSAWALARENPVTLGAATDRADFVDVYLGRCDPNSDGVEGTIELDPRYATYSVGVALFEDALSFAAPPRMLRVSPAIGDGVTRVFAACDPDVTSAHLIAYATPPLGKDPEAIATHPDNPLVFQGLRKNVTIRAGTVGTGSGAIGGKIHLSAPRAGVKLTVVASRAPITATSTYDGMQTTTTTGGDVSYRISNLGAAEYHLMLAAASPSGRTKYLPFGPIRINAPLAGEVVQDVELGVGAVTGRVVVRGAPSTIGQIAVIAMKPTARDPDAYDAATLAAADSTGARGADFELFGLADGPYDLYAIADLNADGAFVDDLLAQHTAGSPTRITIENGAVVTQDFEITIAQ